MTHSPLHIALITVEYPPDKSSYGLGTYTESLARALVAKGHIVHVLTRSPQGDSTEHQGNLTVHRMGPARPDIPADLKSFHLLRLTTRGLLNEWRYRRKLAAKLEQLITTEGIQLIESADATAESLFYRPKHHPHIPFIVKLHGPFAVAELYDKNVPDVVRRIIRTLERRLLLKATHLTAPSATAAAVFRREMGLERSITILPNPPSFEAVQSDPREEDPNLVLFVGRITPAKGIHLLIEAVPRVLERHPAARFLCIGGDAVSDERFSIARTRLLARLPEAARYAVTFTGRLPHSKVAQFMAKAAVCVFPSTFDNFPYTCLEAMSFGKAIVGGDNGGMVELLDGGRAGLLFTPPNVKELGDKLALLLEDRNLRRQLGQAALQRFKSTYTMNRVLSQTLRFYDQAIEGPKFAVEALNSS